jgi:hypothetical protein
MKNGQRGLWCGAAGILVAALVPVGGLSGCSTLDRAYKQEVTWTNTRVVQVVTNTVVVTKTVPVVTERTNIVFVTNAVTGEVAGYATLEPVATNLVAMAVTNFVPVFYTNVVQVPVTNLVAKPEAEATIQAAGTVVNTFAPGFGSLVALALGGLYHSVFEGGMVSEPIRFQLLHQVKNRIHDRLILQIHRFHLVCLRLSAVACDHPIRPAFHSVIH